MMELRSVFAIPVPIKILLNVAELLIVFIDVGVVLLVVVYVHVKVGKLSKSISSNVSLNPALAVEESDLNLITTVVKYLSVLS
tara:strand:- start:32 stop:280 length:249 start_codon:yes stop_codon:yes gene_type:complete